MNTEIKNIDRLIEMYKGKIAELERRKAAILAEEKSIREEMEAYKNGYHAHFDGMKVIADPNNPYVLTLPMPVERNMFYSYNNALWVAIADGIVNDGNFADMMEAWEI